MWQQVTINERVIEIQLIHSETKHLTVLMSESLDHLFNRFFQKADSFN